VVDGVEKIGKGTDGKCYIAHNGGEVGVSPSRYFVSNDPVEWGVSADGRQPVTAGPFAPCRFSTDGVTTIGHVNPQSGPCWAAHGGREHSSYDFETLYWKNALVVIDNAVRETRALEYKDIPRMVAFVVNMVTKTLPELNVKHPEVTRGIASAIVKQMGLKCEFDSNGVMTCSSW
jgi:hypothetical protein